MNVSKPSFTSSVMGLAKMAVGSTSGVGQSTSVISPSLGNKLEAGLQKLCTAVKSMVTKTLSSSGSYKPVSTANSSEGAEKKAWGADEKLTTAMLVGHGSVIAVEVVSGAMEMAKVGGEFLTEVGHMALGSLSGGFGVVNGARSLYKANNANNKTNTLSTCSKQISSIDTKALSPSETKDLQALTKALDFCKDLSQARATDLAVTGTLEIATGVTTIVGAATGVGSPAGLVMASVSLAVSVGLKCCRGYQQTRPAYVDNKNSALETLKKGVEQLEKNIMADPPKALSVADKAMVNTLQAVGMMPKDLPLDKPGDLKTAIKSSDDKAKASGKPATFELLGEAGIKKVFMQETSAFKGFSATTTETKLDTAVGVMELAVNVLEKMAGG